MYITNYLKHLPLLYPNPLKRHPNKRDTITSLLSLPPHNLAHQQQSGVPQTPRQAKSKMTMSYAETAVHAMFKK